MSKLYRTSDFLARRADAAAKVAKNVARARRLARAELTSSGPWQPREPTLPDDRDFGPAMARLPQRQRIFVDVCSAASSRLGGASSRLQQSWARCEQVSLPRQSSSPKQYAARAETSHYRLGERRGAELGTDNAFGSAGGSRRFPDPRIRVPVPEHGRRRRPGRPAAVSARLIGAWPLVSISVGEVMPLL